MKSLQTKTKAARSRSRRIRYRTAGVALAGASVIAVTPITVPPPQAHVLDIQLTAGEDPLQVTIDIVRHGATTPPPPDFTSETPGPPLCTMAPCGGGSPPDQTGVQQAADTAAFLHHQLGDNVSGIFSGTSIRDFDTAEAFASYYPNQDITQLIDLNEANSSFYFPQTVFQTPGALLFEATVALWGAGFTLLPMPGGAPYNGVQLDQLFTNAVDTMYQNGVGNPVVSDTGQVTEVGFNNDASIGAWTLLNVKNPDLFYFIPAIINQLTSGSQKQLLDFGGVVQFSGDPTDGWTLDSWNGTAIPSFPDPLTELFALFRDLILPPQALVSNTVSALLTGDPTTILNTIVAGVQQIASAIIQTPINLIDYIREAVSGGGLLTSLGAEPSFGALLGGFNPGDLSTELANLFPTTELAGLLPGGLGSMVSDALASL